MSIQRSRLNLYNPKDGGYYILQYAVDANGIILGECIGTIPGGGEVRRPDLAGKTIEFENIDHPEKVKVTFPRKLTDFGRGTKIEKELNTDVAEEIVFLDSFTELTFRLYLDNNGKIIQAVLPVRKNQMSRHTPYKLDRSVDGCLKLSINESKFQNLKLSGYGKDGKFYSVLFYDDGLYNRPDVLRADDQLEKNLEILLYHDEYKKTAAPNSRLQELVKQTAELPGIGSRMDIIDLIVANTMSKQFNEIVFGNEIDDHEHELLGTIVQDIGHIALLGNPGTLKTVLAEIIHEANKEAGIVQGDLIIVNGRDVVGTHVGHSEDIMKKAIEKAISTRGTLFVDEFHTLDDTGGKQKSSQFGALAAKLLVAATENHRDEFCLIIAGYPKQMKQAIKNIDPGLKDRISNTFILNDYKPEELEAIFYYLLPNRFKLDEDAKTLLSQKIKDAYDNRDETFSNGRLMRKLVNHLVSVLKLRLYKENVYTDFFDNLDKNAVSKDVIDQAKDVGATITLADVQSVHLGLLEDIEDDVDNFEEDLLEEYAAKKREKIKMGFDPKKSVEFKKDEEEPKDTANDDEKPKRQRRVPGNRL